MDLFDYQMMLQAVKIGERGRTNTAPNPWVGCVIVKNGIVIAEGYHTHAGAPHAEVAALAKTADAQNATVYVTLEPCAHYGKTPPCVEALIKRGIDRVVVGTLDPDSRVSGKGIQQLREAGVDVVVGVAEKEVKRSLAPYLYQRTYNNVYTVLKIACSLDGHMFANDHTSQWITGPESLVDVHHLRSESQAIITGAGTIKFDNPKMNVRAPVTPPMNPLLRVVLDSRGSSDIEANVFNLDFGPSLLVTTAQCPEDTIQRFTDRGVEVFVASESAGKVCLAEVFQLLTSKGVIQAMVEAGPTLTSEIIEQRLFQQLTAYIGPKILGGNGVCFSKYIPWSSLSEALSLKTTSHKLLGDTARIDYVYSV